MNKIKEAITKPEISWWIGIITIIVSGAALLTKLDGRISMVEVKANTCEAEQQSQELVLTEIKVRLAEIQKDIQYIKLNMR